MSYIPATNEEIKNLPRCKKCGQYATRLEYHKCEILNRCIECNGLVTETDGCKNCHDNCRIEL